MDAAAHHAVMTAAMKAKRASAASAAAAACARRGLREMYVPSRLLHGRSRSCPVGRDGLYGQGRRRVSPAPRVDTRHESGATAWARSSGRNGAKGAPGGTSRGGIAPSSAIGRVGMRDFFDGDASAISRTRAGA